ncbi:XdhC family protein [Microvirga sp. 2YAF29]|uniref:XdhC family protein n=1 Tax=Microvirga sp. 2YAF29 TaxID=3233031 RepID=UPI003F997848
MLRSDRAAMDGVLFAIPPIASACTAAAPEAAIAAMPLQVLRFLADAAERGERNALVTITGLSGSSSRPVGTLMGVTEDCSFAGSFSGGCIEAAVVAEAQEAIRAGKPRQVRYGAGSPYLDIRLPCGGGVDLLFQPNPDPESLRRASSLLEQRCPLSLIQEVSGGLRVIPDASRIVEGWKGDTFVSWYAPSLKIVVVGQGAESLALVQLGSTFGADMHLLTPDGRVGALASDMGARVEFLNMPRPTQPLATDPWSAVVFLFHDHAWEPALMAQALSQPAFFIGAMGSRRTHAQRMEKLRERGVPEASLSRIVAPLGLIPSARDPFTLGLSALAQVVEGYRQQTAIPSEVRNEVQASVDRSLKSSTVSTS